MSLRLLMMGTGTFALPTFLSLYDSKHEVVGLVTQPDRTGRGHHRHPHPMKDAALEHGTPVFQPASANAPESLARLRGFNADLFVVAAYGQILSAELLTIPRLGAINVHASLLPKYRGAAPILYAVLNGESETGITIFKIEPRLDAGPILGMASTPIGAKETTGDLTQRLAELSPPLTLEVIDQLEAGTTEEIEQDQSLVTKAPSMNKEVGEIDWSQPSALIERHVRAMQPWPKPYTFLHSDDLPAVRVLILDVDPISVADRDGEPGTLFVTEGGEGFYVTTGDGAVQVNRLQLAGKRAMSAAEFLRGHSFAAGDRLGPDDSAASE